MRGLKGDAMKNVVLGISLIVAALAGPAAGVCAQPLTRDLGGDKEGCPMKLVYDPAVFKVAPQVAETFARPDLDDLVKMEGLAGIGSFRERRTGRVWYLYSSLGMSCDPYFLFLSATKGKERVEVGGEIMSFLGTSEFTVKSRLNLYFEIEQRLVWENGRPVEKAPAYYPVRKATKSLKKLALAPDKAAAASEALPAGVELSVIGYLPSAKPPRALVKTPGGRQGWIDLDDDSLEGVRLPGD